jgi:hypothetical protein
MTLNPAFGGTLDPSCIIVYTATILDGETSGVITHNRNRLARACLPSFNGDFTGNIASTTWDENSITVSVTVAPLGENFSIPVVVIF